MRRTRRSLAAAVLLGLPLALGLPGGASREARAAEPIAGLRSLAMGGALRAAATGAEGTQLNPSGIAFYRQYAVTAFYGFGVQQLGHALHVSVADSVTQARVAMGLYYNFIHDSPTLSLNVAEAEMANARIVRASDVRLTRQGHELGVMTAFPLGDRFILGLTTKYGYYSMSAPLQEKLPADFMSANPRIDKDKVYDLGSVNNAVSFDIGITIRAMERLSIGLVGQNLWGHGVEMPTLLGGGLAIQFTPRLTVAADVLVNFNGYQNCGGASDSDDPCNLRQLPDAPASSNRTVVRVGGGAEYNIADKVPLRAGYLYDSNQGGHHISAGLGYLSPRFGIDLAMRQRLSAGPETILLAGFRIFRD